VSIHGNLYLTLYGDRTESHVPLNGRRMDVPGMGRCMASGGSGAPYFLECDASMAPRAAMVSVRFEDKDGDNDRITARSQTSYSPFPAELSLDPLNADIAYSIFKGPLAWVTVVTLEPVAWVTAPVTIDGLQLGAYEAKLN
jgi:hypothetical protein